MSIFGRWGNLLFRSTDFSQGWNGDGKQLSELNTGTYVYSIKMEYLDENGFPFYFLASGDVALVR